MRALGTHISIYPTIANLSGPPRESILNSRARIDNTPSLIIAALFNAFVRPFNAISGAYARSRSAGSPDLPGPINAHTYARARAGVARGRVCAARVHAAALEAASPGRSALLVFPAGVCTVP